MPRSRSPGLSPVTVGTAFNSSQSPQRPDVSVMVISEDEEDEHQDVARFLSPGGSGGVDGGGQSTGSVSPNSPFAVIVPVPAPRRKRVSVTSSASHPSSASEPERGRVGSGQAGAVTAGTLRTGPSSPMDVSMRSFRAALPRAGTSSSTSGGSLGQSRGGQTMSIVAHSDSAGSRDAVTIPWKPSGLVYDVRMMSHMALDKEDQDHPECPDRLRRIYEALRDAGYLYQFKRIGARVATSEEVLFFHGSEYHRLMQTTESLSQVQLVDLAKRYNSIYFNQNTAFCALLSCGGLLELVEAVWQDRARNGFALIRPPGHHAEKDEAMYGEQLDSDFSLTSFSYSRGFCIYNNVVIATRHLQRRCGARRVMILDWDIHHGNGTQQAFYDDPSVLFVSIHRYDNGRFYPSSTDANYTEIGGKGARGRNINIPWPYGGFDDADYMHMFQHIIMPIAHEFDPEFVLVSCGFDAAIDDPIGCCRVTPAGFSQMTYMLSGLAGGKIVLALEGGYNLASISNSATACAKVLLGHPPDRIEDTQPAMETIELAASITVALAPYWNSLTPLSLRTIAVEDGERGKANGNAKDDGTDDGAVMSLEDMMLGQREMILQERFKAYAVANTSGTFDGHIYWSDCESATSVLFVHDGPFFRGQNMVAENLLDPTQSTVIDATIPYLKFFHKRKWTFIDCMLPRYDTRQASIARYERLKERPVRISDAKRDSIDTMICRLFDLILENGKTRRLIVVVAGSAVDSVAELIATKDVEKVVSGVILVCPVGAPPPMLRGPGASPSKSEWYRKKTTCLLTDDAIPAGSSIKSHPRVSQCISTGAIATPSMVLLRNKDRLFTLLTALGSEKM